MILQNRKTILYLKRKVAEQDERIDGLTSIIEGLSATLAQLQAKGGNISGSAVQGGDNTALLKELGMMIDRINDNYVSKQELQKILKQQGKADVSKKKPEAKTKTNIGGNFDPNFEAIAALNPTDAVILKTDAKLRGFFKKTGVPWLETRFDSLSDTYESILLIGNHFGATKKAKALVSDIKAGLAKITAKKTNLRKKRVLLVISRDVDRLQNIWVAGGKSFLGEILRICGGKNIFEDLGPAYAQIGQEEILVRDPEVIIEVMAVEKAPDQNRVLALWSRLGTVRAIKDGKIFIINDRFMTIPGPRIPEIAKVFMNCLYD